MEMVKAMEGEGDGKKEEPEPVIPAYLMDSAPVPALEVGHAYPDELDNRADTNIRAQAMMMPGATEARLP